MAGESNIERPTQGGACLFWLLTLMGLATFAPCIILPPWRQYQALEMAAQIEQHHLDALQHQVDRERRLLDAIRSDPGVVARLAQRELRFRRVDSQAVHVSVPATRVEAEAPFVPEPPRPPAVIARAVSVLPRFDYDRVFCGDQTRPIVMGMSVALIGAAFALSGRLAEGRRARHE